MLYIAPMTYILWTKENGKPPVLGLVDKFFASTGMVNHHTHKQFEKIVGRKVAKAALKRYEEEQEELAEKEEHGHVGRA